VSGQFTADGHASATVARAGKSALTVSLQLVTPDPYQIKLQLVAKLGLVKGNFLPPGTNRTARVPGAGLQSANGGGGFFLGPGQPGVFQLESR
jgi:hypothetical protein